MKINRSPSARIVAGIAALGLALPTVDAQAHGHATAGERLDTKQMCVDAASLGQQLRDRGEYRKADDLFLACSAALCPPIVAASCTRWLHDLKAVMPSIVVGAQDANGRDLTDVSVSLDGALLEGALDGSPRAADPGLHTVRFEAHGRAPIEEHIVLRSGEKSRVVVVKFPLLVTTAPDLAPAPVPTPVTIAPSPAATAPGPATAPTATPRVAEVGPGSQKILGLAVAGAGVAAVAAASVFGALTLSAVSRQKRECASADDCGARPQAESDHATAVTDGTISTVGFIAGGALLAGGALFFFTARSTSPASSQPAGLLVTPSAGPGGGGMTLRGRF